MKTIAGIKNYKSYLYLIFLKVEILKLSNTMTREFSFGFNRPQEIVSWKTDQKYPIARDMEKKGICNREYIKGIENRV